MRRPARRSAAVARSLWTARIWPLFAGAVTAVGVAAASNVFGWLALGVVYAVVSLFADNACNVLTDGTKFGKFGSGHPDLVPYQAFPASDGYFIVACLTNAFYKRMASALGRDDLLTDPKFATNPSRVTHRAEVVGVLSEIFRTNTVEHWIALLEANDIPTCRVNSLDEILAHPQIAANGLVVELD